MNNAKILVNPQYAVKFALRFVIIVLAGFGLFGILILALLNRNIGPTYVEGLSALSQLQMRLPRILLITAFTQTIILCGIVLLLALLWSHGIAGPLVRFKRCLRETARGNILKEPVVFRKTDQLHALAQALSETNLAFQERNVKMLTLWVGAKKLLDECRRLHEQGKSDTPSFSKNLANVKAIYLEMKNCYSPKNSPG